MERLTQKENDRLIFVKQDNGEYIHAYWDEDNFKAIEKLADYEDLEEQGLLVELPCKVGDTVYRINTEPKPSVIPMYVSEISFVSHPEIKYVKTEIKVIDLKTMQPNYYVPTSIGASIFLTLEEAKKKLEEMKKNDNR